MNKIIIAVLLVCTAVTAVFAQQITVAVLPTIATTLSDDEVEAITDKIRGAALKMLPKAAFGLLTQDVVIKRLGGMDDYAKECSASTCIVDLGKKAQVDYIAQATVGKLGKRLRLKVELYDVNNTGNMLALFDEMYDNFNALYKDIDKSTPNMFKEIPGVAAPAVASASSAAQQQVAVSASSGAVVSIGSIKSVKIGTQTWMAENLNVEVEGSKCYDNKPENCAKYGRLYTWEAAKKACPVGWHLPTNKEWDILYRFADGSSGTESPYRSETAGKFLKAKSGWNKNGNGEDKFGFAALPGGDGYSTGNFDNVGNHGYWWSASEGDASNAYYRNMYYSNDFADWYNLIKSLLQSVRCVRD